MADTEHETSETTTTPATATTAAPTATAFPPQTGLVRRLHVVETCRLMGFPDDYLVADGEDKLSGGVVRLKKMRDGKFGIFYSGTTAPASAYRTEDEAMAAFRKLAVKIRNCATPTTNSVVANAVARMRAGRE